MKRRLRLIVAFLGLCLTGVGGILLSSSLPVNGQGQVVAQAASSAVAQQGLAIEIALRKVFYIPAGTAGRTPAGFIRVPASSKREFEAKPIAAIKFAPEMVGDKVRVTVSIISGDAAGLKTCSDWKTLKESPLASYTLGEGEEGKVPQLASLGLSLGDGVLKFRAVPLRILQSQDPEVVGGGCGCCGCNGLSCCPLSGKCLACADCGSCCCFA